MSSMTEMANSLQCERKVILENVLAKYKYLSKLKLNTNSLI